MEALTLLPFRFRALSSGEFVCVSESGDFVGLSEDHLKALAQAPQELPLSLLMNLKAKFFLASDVSPGVLRLLASRVITKKASILNGPALHIIVPTLFCEHSCQYCQVSRATSSSSNTISDGDLSRATDRIFESPADCLTIEYQGGDPLLRFDLVRSSIVEISDRNRTEGRKIRFVVASTLHQLDEEMCSFFGHHDVKLSTSLDGPAWLHNRNRPKPGRDAYEGTLRGLDLARRRIGDDCVSALTTVTRHALNHAVPIVDEYLARGFSEIFLRPISKYGFASRNRSGLHYSWAEFVAFYEAAFGYIEELNRNGTHFREIGATILLNKILSPFDSGYVDLQSPSGAGLAVLVYNYDGFVYPSDEARMLAEMGDVSLRLGRIEEPLRNLLESPVQRQLINASINWFTPTCSTCAYLPYCGPDPISAHNQRRFMTAPVSTTDHCIRQKWLMDFLFEKLLDPLSEFPTTAERWIAKDNVGSCA